MANGWRQYVLYICAMGTLSVSTVYAAYSLSENIWRAATNSAQQSPRDLSRVAKYFAAKASSDRKARPAERPLVVALVKPEIHPAALAAAMDQTELASASEHPDRHPAEATLAHDTDLGTKIDVASWRRPAVQVAGLACSADGCDDNAPDQRAADGAPDIPDAAIRVASAEDEAETVEFATSDEADAEVGAEAGAEDPAKALPKPYRLGKGRAALLPGGRQKPQRKVLAQYGDEPAIVKFFSAQGGKSGLRVAETPGDIIRQSLLRGTI